MLPYDPVRRVVMLIKQPRAAVLDAGEDAIFEAIAGSLDGARPEDRIRDEALEGGGLRLGELTDAKTLILAQALLLRSSDLL